MAASHPRPPLAFSLTDWRPRRPLRRTAQITLPIYASVARTAGQDPLRFALPALLACSNAFLLPASTPPNAIAYGTGFFSIRTMASHGLGLSLLGASISWAVAEALGPVVFGGYHADEQQ